MTINSQFDLQFERDVPISVEQIWDGWTNPKTLVKWFCPRPWKVIDCQINLIPGGIFRTVMQSPEGKNMPDNLGTFLAVEKNKRLVWTNALGPEFRPSPKLDAHLGFHFVADLRFTRLPSGGANYKALVMHPDEASRQSHAQMGFEEGWGIALDQLVELYK